MRVAVYGGSFNPVHVGHLLVCGWLRWTGRAEVVWLVPSFAHPLKRANDEAAAPFDVRVRWCAAVAREVPGVEVCAIEGDLPVPSYTIDTLRALGARHPEHRFRFVLGADLADEVSRWKDWAAIEEEYAPVWVGRQGHPVPAGSVGFPPVSSTEIRARVGRGEPVDHLVPAAILDEVQATWER